MEEKSGVFTDEQKKELENLIGGKWKPEPIAVGKTILHGDKLREAINKALDERTPLIEGLCYEGGVIQMFADDGLGKSTVLLNAMIEASAGLPIFKGLAVPRPLNIIWNCAERPLDEPLERIRLMEQVVKPNLNNMVFDKEIQTMDLNDKKGLADYMVHLFDMVNVFENMRVDIVVIDPIYAITGGDLSKPEAVHTINHLIRTIQNRYGCAVIYTHHSNRGTIFEGKRTEGDMYGNRFLSANVTGQFHIKKTEDGVSLNCKKNTYGNLLSHIPLIYDELTQTLSISKDSEDFNKRDKILIFLRRKHAEKKEFVLREISNQLKVSDAYIRTTINPYVRTGHIVNKGAKGLKAVYYVEKNV